MSNPPAQADRPITELLKELAGQVSLLVRQEFELARAEILRKLSEARGPAAAFGLAALFALGAFGALTALLIIAIALVVPLWSAALAVTVIFAVVAGAAAATGRSQLRRLGSPVPTQTIQTIKEDVNAVRSGIERGRR